MNKLIDLLLILNLNFLVICISVSILLFAVDNTSVGEAISDYILSIIAKRDKKMINEIIKYYEEEVKK